ncbi:3827_t:CDS:2 [Entrophospora sp. SA101]|nr:3827_t:CDS:2 [Entrophospora sp. SA101]
MSGLGAIRNLTRLGGVPISHARKLNSTHTLKKKQEKTIYGFDR